MRLLWKKAPAAQLDLLDAKLDASWQTNSASDGPAATDSLEDDSPAPVANTSVASTGLPLLVSIALIYEDPNNPRTEFPDADIDELADDIRQHGILQAITVHPADTQGRYRIHFGAKRWRAAKVAGLDAVPVVVRDAPADPYVQVAENQRRHGLPPLDLARFIKDRVDAGDSNAFIAKRMRMNLTTVAHHLSLLDLLPMLDRALRSGRCTSPRTLHELSKLHQVEPDQVRTLMDSESEITRTAVAAVKAKRPTPARSSKASAQADVIAQANAACDRLERVLAQVEPRDGVWIALPDLVALRIRVEDLAKIWLQGSDRQTP